MEGFPLEIPTDAGEEGAIRYIYGLGREAWPFLLLLLMVAVAAGYWWARRRRRRDTIAQERLAHIRAVCREDHFTPEEEAALLRALRRAHPATPDAAVVSPEYFEDFLAPSLARETDDATYRAIRAKLFGTPETPPAPPF